MSNELYHYGIPGMRWGKRKKQLKQEYKSRIKKANDKWNKEYGSLEDQYTYGKKTNAKTNAMLDKRMDRVDKTYRNEISKAKADYKQGKANLKAEKQEFKGNVRLMNAHGLPGSAYDQFTGGQSTKFYNDLRNKKGKVYADNVRKSLNRKYTANLSAGLITLGASIVGPIVYEKIKNNEKVNLKNFKNYTIR